MLVDPDTLTWEATIWCSKCEQPVAHTRGKMVIIGDNIYPMNLHVDSRQAQEHQCR